MPSPKTRNRYEPPSVLCCANGALLSLMNVHAACAPPDSHTRSGHMPRACAFKR
jgi:hypothetical protein